MSDIGTRSGREDGSTHHNISDAESASIISQRASRNNVSANTTPIEQTHRPHPEDFRPHAEDQPPPSSPRNEAQQHNDIDEFEVIEDDEIHEAINAAKRFNSVSLPQGAMAAASMVITGAVAGGVAAYLKSKSTNK
ncbi:hypothetical protein VI817_007184 [Penicillium citrinum]|nr:hypothetical protein VI817_007184 [Penicillium citrinum]